MKLGDSVGIKAPQFYANEKGMSEDMNFFNEAAYKNIVDLVALLLAPSGGTSSDPDMIIGEGLRLTWTTAMTASLSPGMALSFTGRYFTSGAWGFTAESGALFGAICPVAAAVAVSVGDATHDRYDTIEIRPVRTDYGADDRDYKDPSTGAITTASTDAKVSYDYEVQVLEGTPDASPVAPDHTAGWIKIAEVYVPQSAVGLAQSNYRLCEEINNWTAEATASIRKRWTLLSLSDMFHTFTSTANKLLVVNAGATAVETFPSTYTAQGKKVVRVNSGATALELSDELTRIAKSVGGGINSITADTVGTDSDGYGTVLVDSRTQAITYTLPAASTNAERRIVVKVLYVGGDVTIAVDGSDKIDGKSVLKLCGRYDKAVLVSDGAATWHIESLRVSFDTGYIYRTLWDNKHLGCVTIVTTGRAGTFLIGEVITEATSGNTGIIIADDGTNMVLKEVTGGGNFTSTRTITGSTSGATATVNANTINVDTALTHNLNFNPWEMDVKPFVSTDGTDANSFLSLLSSSYTLGEAGSTDLCILGASANAFTLHTCSGYGGYIYIDGSNGHRVQVGGSVHSYIRTYLRAVA